MNETGLLEAAPWHHQIVSNRTGRRWVARESDRYAVSVDSGLLHSNLDCRWVRQRPSKHVAIVGQFLVSQVLAHRERPSEVPAVKVNLGHRVVEAIETCDTCSGHSA
jgi:hypothetical protein